MMNNFMQEVQDDRSAYQNQMNYINEYGEEVYPQMRSAGPPTYLPPSISSKQRDHRTTGKKDKNKKDKKHKKKTKKNKRRNQSDDSEEDDSQWA